jgi:chromosome segregation ATPase
MNPTNTLNKLRRDLKACEEHIRNLERSILKLNESHEQAEKIRNVTSEQMAAYEQEAEMLLTKKKELGVSEELMEEDI